MRSNVSVNQSTSVRGGVGFIGMLTIAFVVLKLCNVIQWSWLWVLAPLWISFLLTIIVLVIILIGLIWLHS